MTTTAAETFPEELAAFRKEHGLTWAQLGELVGYRGDTLQKVGSGAKPPTGPMRKKFRSAVRRANASPGSDGIQPGGEASAGGRAPGDEPGDLPPLPEPPDPAAADDGEESLVSLAGGGRKVTVRNLSHFQRIELSLLTFLVGKEIEYQRPISGGRVELASVHQMGLADLLPAADAAVIRENGPEIANAWAEWAKTSPRVNTLLSFLVIEGGSKGVAVVMGKTFLRIAQNHGFDPLSFLMAPFRGDELAAFGTPQADSGDFYVEPHPADDLTAVFQQGPDGSGGPDLGGGIGFRNVEGGVEASRPPD